MRPKRLVSLLFRRDSGLEANKRHYYPRLIRHPALDAVLGYRPRAVISQAPHQVRGDGIVGVQVCLRTDSSQGCAVKDGLGGEQLYDGRLRG